MNGNSTTKTQVLFKWCKLFQKVYTCCPFMHKEAETVYTTIFLPTITYPFPATTLTIADLDKAQSMTTPTIISHMGYNCNMPKAVIYAPSTHRGLGLKHLHTEHVKQCWFSSLCSQKHFLVLPNTFASKIYLSLSLTILIPFQKSDLFLIFCKSQSATNSPSYWLNNLTCQIAYSLFVINLLNYFMCIWLSLSITHEIPSKNHQCIHHWVIPLAST